MSMGRSGYIALVGRPNVGKSTLLNRLINKKISITSKKPQTTRHQILGIHTHEDMQAIFVDTPGIHKKTPRKINKAMNQAAYDAISDVDAICFVVEALTFNVEDKLVLSKLAASKCPVILLLNKIDQVKDKAKLLPFMDELQAQLDFKAIIPVSAKANDNVSLILETVKEFLPEGPHLFPAEQLTDRRGDFLAAEIIREKLTRQLGEELPYILGVEIDKFAEEKQILHVHGIIWVERDTQKKIIIGDKGEQLKLIATKARKAMEIMFDQKVYLNVWIKVKPGWSGTDAGLQKLGYM